MSFSALVRVDAEVCSRLFLTFGFVVPRLNACADLDRLRDEPIERMSGGLLLCSLDGLPLTLREHLVLYDHVDVKCSPVVRTADVCDAVCRNAQSRCLERLLERRLVVSRREVRRIDLVERSAEPFADEGPCGHDATVEVDGSHERFEGIDEYCALLATARLLLATVEQQVAAEVDLARDEVERGLADEERLHLGEPTLALLGETFEEPLADEKAEDGVPKQFVCFVVAAACVFVGERSVREGAVECLRIRKGMTDARF